MLLSLTVLAAGPAEVRIVGFYSACCWLTSSTRILAHRKWWRMQDLSACWCVCVAAGSTTHVIDASRGLVVEHIERWKSEPGEVRRQQHRFDESYTCKGVH
jgi:hypothetical protein